MFASKNNKNSKGNRKNGMKKDKAKLTLEEEIQLLRAKVDALNKELVKVTETHTKRINNLLKKQKFHDR